MDKKLKIIGYCSVFFGVAAVALSISAFMGFPLALLYAIVSGFIGFIFTNIYLVINVRHEINKKILNAGMIGLLLNSIPIIIILVIKFLKR